MKHTQFEEWLLLSLYHELTEEEQTLFANHLSTCTRCQRDSRELKSLHETLAHRSSTVAREMLLQEARSNIQVRIHSNKMHRSGWERLKDWMGDLLAPPIQVALGGIALFAMGIFAGYYLFLSSSNNGFLTSPTASISSAMETGESQISNLRFLDRDVQSGTVEFTFETVTPVRVRGNVNDERIQKMLAHALVSNRNAGTRLRAITMIGAQTDQKQIGAPLLEPAVKSALITALLHDRNLGVRKEALSVLRNYLPDPAIVRAFLDVLAKENNTGLKITAINSLDLSKNENQPMNREILEMLKHTAQSDDNNYIRIKARTALQEVQQ